VLITYQDTVHTSTSLGYHKSSDVEYRTQAFARRPMRPWRFLVVVVAFLINPVSHGFAQTGPKLHDINGFMAKGALHELDPELMRRRLSLEDIAKAGFNGEPTEIENVLAWMAKSEKLSSRVEEPVEVKGKISVFLPPNTMGDEAYTACYYGFSYNGLGLSGSGGKLVLVRAEKHPQLPRPSRPWNRGQVLSTQLFRLGYLKPDPILRQYRDKAGSPAGHAVLEPKSNVLIVTDTQKALDSLRAHVDGEILEAMGVPASKEPEPGNALRPPSLGAIASSETIHFYLMAFARWNEFPLAPTQDRAVAARRYPEANVWMNEEGYRALAAEYRRINEFVRLARETGGEDWVDPNPARTLSLAEQKRRAIRFGLATPGPTGPNTPKNKKAARKR
jgi:hypothetical protein